MERKSSLLVFTFLLLIQGYVADEEVHEFFARAGPRGQSYCSNPTGTCDQTTPCDIGACCNNYCVGPADIPVVPENGICTTGICNTCEFGQYCETGGVGSTGQCLPAPFKKDAGCTGCTSSNDCATGFCNSGTCLYRQLSLGAQCTVSGQCKLGLDCVGGFCKNQIADYASCSHGTYGLCSLNFSCISPDSNLNDPVFNCVPSRKEGEDCGTDSDCEHWHACSLLTNKCIKEFSLAAGESCVTGKQNQCQRGLVCDLQTAKCLKIADGTQCTFDSCAVPFQSCECQGSSTGCKPSAGTCLTQYSAVENCFLDNNCKPLDPLKLTGVVNFPLPPECGHQKCLSELLDYFCCSYCDSGLSLPAGMPINCATRQYLEPNCCAISDPVNTCRRKGTCTGSTTPPTTSKATSATGTAATGGNTGTAGTTGTNGNTGTAATGGNTATAGTTGTNAATTGATGQTGNTQGTNNPTGQTGNPTGATTNNGNPTGTNQGTEVPTQDTNDVAGFVVQSVYVVTVILLFAF